MHKIENTFWVYSTFSTTNLQKKLNNFFLFSRESTITELQQETSARQETIEKLHSEREDLMQKIQAGEGTSVALQQLQEQNVIKLTSG